MPFLRVPEGHADAVALEEKRDMQLNYRRCDKCGLDIDGSPDHTERDRMGPPRFVTLRFPRFYGTGELSWNYHEVDLCRTCVVKIFSVPETWHKLGLKIPGSIAGVPPYGTGGGDA